MTIYCNDTAGLDILSKPSAIRLHLVRSLAIGSKATAEDGRCIKESAGQATFWPSSEARRRGKQVLRGELLIGKTLKPSFIFPRFSLRVSLAGLALGAAFFILLINGAFTFQYTLDLLSFEAPDFVPAAVDATDALLTEKVKIVTARAPGITPRSRAPTGSVRPRKGDYMGAENGNQRLLSRYDFGLGMV